MSDWMFVDQVSVVNRVFPKQDLALCQSGGANVRRAAVCSELPATGAASTRKSRWWPEKRA